MKVLRNTLLVTLYFTAVVLIPGAAALAATDITSDVAPLSARTERTPAPYDGYVWAAGYWDWNGHWYTRISGAFIPERRGRHWVPARWEQVEANWQLLRGHWENNR